MPSSKTPFLLTGVTGGLGAKILEDLLNKHAVPASSIIATSRSSSNKKRFESQGLQFRVADFKDAASLNDAFSQVENLLFVSSSERDTTTRNAEHQNVINAAKAAGVDKVWYVSLALGGLGNESKIGFQQAHYETERLLAESGLDFISIRAGLYTDAFPLFLNWYPSSKSVPLPRLTPPVTASKVAFTTRNELAEGIATLLAKGLSAFPSIKPQTKYNIVPLTAGSTASLIDIVNAINKGRGTNIPIEYLSPEDWITASATDDVGGKSRAWFEARLIFMQGIVEGDAALVDPSLETLLGRKPETGEHAVERILRENPEYTWHQNHVR
ncbi:related to nucleoside-diphosphate-sugar epimerases [Ramularia collo-cygni]|uniref:Related to nucleoside-diphosphate-sugar epimerases n=1 Tax=Ramularia collo-cygni TaxID=112498 RepID=A0A2D3VKU2_9PEZI|nr:related to nucleoside-diphosphate-sugar epimerases [Ramularia collo-cygni]CZT21733.1 related to nucleoside-diphosphate-sugar epimerases [Ramularia collo-cygni]